MDLKHLQLSLQQPHLAPVELWDPPYCGDIPIRIDNHGRWYYLDSAIQRPELVKLFASVLIKQQEHYFLVTPAEKVRIQVENAAFVIVAVEQQIESEAVVATTNLGLPLVIGMEYPLFLQAQADGQLLPYLQLWRGLTAKFNRPAYYQLIELAQLNQSVQPHRLEIYSAGQCYHLGDVD